MRSAWAITYCKDWREPDSRANDRSAANAVPADFDTHGPSGVRKAMHMSTLSIGLALAIRIVLVLLFLPFSALDKVLDFRAAVAQAQEEVPNKAVAAALILVGLFIEVFMSAGVVSGIA